MLGQGQRARVLGQGQRARVLGQGQRARVLEQGQRARVLLLLLLLPLGMTAKDLAPPLLLLLLPVMQLL